MLSSIHLKLCCASGHVRHTLGNVATLSPPWPIFDSAAWGSGSAVWVYSHTVRWFWCPTRQKHCSERCVPGSTRHALCCDTCQHMGVNVPHREHIWYSHSYSHGRTKRTLCEHKVGMWQPRNRINIPIIRIRFVFLLPWTIVLYSKWLSSHMLMQETHIFSFLPTIEHSPKE